MSTRKAKRPGLIEEPRDIIKTAVKKVIVESIIKDKLRKKTFIITIFDCKTSIVINIGNKEVYCIDCILLKNSNTGIYDTGMLNKARWDIDCSIGDPFKKGDDSVTIIKLLLTYINETYPTVKQLLFTDMSTKECDDGGSVNLAAMKVFTDNKTWYESHFDVIMDKKYKEMYDKMKKDATNKKKELSFDGFIGYLNINTIPIPIEDMKNIYENTSTWQDFFSNIRDNIGVSKFCIWLSKNGWFDNFIRIILKFNTMLLEFIFEPKQYDNISYRILNTTGGKYRKTLKHRRS